MKISTPSCKFYDLYVVRLLFDNSSNLIYYDLYSIKCGYYVVILQIGFIIMTWTVCSVVIMLLLLKLE